MHKAQLILDAINSQLESLVQSGVIKQAIRNRAITPDKYPCVCLKMGADTPLSQNPNFVDSELSINTDIYLSIVDTDLDKEMLRIRAAIHKSIFENHNLNLDFVISVTSAGQSEPEYDGDTESYTGALRLSWLIQYRTKYNDPT